MKNRLVALLFLLAVGGIVSCGKSTPKSVFPVGGEVFVGATPAEGAKIVLQPAGDSSAQGWPEGFPRAIVAADGTFRVSTFAPEDGAPPGEYIVIVTWPEPAPDEGGGERDSVPKDRLRGRYSDPQTSTLKARVDTQATKLPRFDLKR